MYKIGTQVSFRDSVQQDKREKKRFKAKQPSAVGRIQSSNRSGFERMYNDDPVWSIFIPTMPWYYDAFFFGGR